MKASMEKRRHYPDGSQLRAYVTDEQHARYTAGARASGAPSLAAWVRDVLDEAAALACASARNPRLDRPGWRRQLPLELTSGSKQTVLRDLDLQLATARMVRDQLFRLRRTDDVGI